MARAAVADAAVPSATFVPEAATGASGAMIGGAMMMVDVSVPVAMPVPDAGEEPAVSANAVPTRNESHCLTAPNAEVLVDPADDDDETGAAEVAGADEDAGAGVEAGVEVTAETTAAVGVVVGVAAGVVVLAGARVVVVAVVIVVVAGVVMTVVEAVIVGAETEDDAVVLASVEEETAEAARSVLDGVEGGTITVEEAEAVDDETDGPTEMPAPDGAETKIDVEATEPSPTCQYSVSPTFVIIPELENPGGTNPPQNICVPDAANTAEPAPVN